MQAHGGGSMKEFVKILIAGVISLFIVGWLTIKSNNMINSMRLNIPLPGAGIEPFQVVGQISRMGKVKLLMFCMDDDLVYIYDTPDSFSGKVMVNGCKDKGGKW